MLPTVIMNDPKGIIDIHSHILPDVDDGAKNMRESVKMLLLAASQGVIGVIATPHYSRRNTIEGLDQLRNELEGRIRRFYPDFFIHLGQETYYHEELCSRLHDGKAMTMAGSRYVLVEFETSVSYKRLLQAIRKLSIAGYKPILAHMERYGCLRKAGVGELLACGCALQMNYESLEGHWFSPEVRWCRNQIKKGSIHLLGTDMHRLSHRPPRIEKAWKWLETHISPEEVKRMTYANPVHIINDERLADAGRSKYRKNRKNR
ncbi:MAG: CpsB/CapC family capsule biosynthesis tyrosine phosphatase [Brotaphodocola sp.]